MPSETKEPSSIKKDVYLPARFKREALKKAAQLGFTFRGKPNLSAYVRFLIIRDSIEQTRHMLDMEKEEKKDLEEAIEEMACAHMKANRRSPNATRDMLLKAGLNPFAADQFIEKCKRRT